MFEIPQIVLGFIVGILIGLTGVGGGAIMTPVLILGFGISPLIAVGTDLLFASITKITAVGIHIKHKTIAWRPTLFLGLGSIPAVGITLLFIHQKPSDFVDGLIVGTLGIALVVTGLLILIHELINHFSDGWKESHWLVSHIGDRLKSSRWPITIFCGVIIGALVALSSIGAGAIGAAVLLSLYGHRPIRTLIGADITHAFFLSSIAGISHFASGNTDLTLLGSLLIGSIPGVWIGSHLGLKTADHYIRWLVAFVILLSGILFLWKQ